MKWMRMVAVVTVTAALALGATGCAKKAEDEAAGGAPAAEPASGIKKAIEATPIPKE